MTTNSNLQNLLAHSVARTLRQGVDTIGAMDDALYTKSEKTAFADGGAIGAHFRHCLEFVNCFLTGIENGRVDYNRRGRKSLLESDREYAIAEFSRTIQSLENLSLPETANALLVKPEDSAGDEEYWCASSIERELEFLQSHTIHHFALIGFKMRAAGFRLPAEFGVAPSTLRFWQREKSAVR